jgi:hypothetical protein
MRGVPGCLRSGRRFTWAALGLSGGRSHRDVGSAVQPLGGLLAGLLAIPGTDRPGPGTTLAIGGLPVFRSEANATTLAADGDDRGGLLGRGVCTDAVVVLSLLVSEI